MASLCYPRTTQLAILLILESYVKSAVVINCKPLSKRVSSRRVSARLPFVQLMAGGAKISCFARPAQSRNFPWWYKTGRDSQREKRNSFECSWCFFGKTLNLWISRKFYNFFPPKCFKFGPLLSEENKIFRRKGWRNENIIFCNDAIMICIMTRFKSKNTWTSVIMHIII